MMLQPLIAQHTSDLRTLCAQEHIVECIIFGYATRRDFDNTSDVDMVVRFDSDQRVTLFRLNRLAQNMSAIMGRSVDLHTWAEIHPRIQTKIRREGVPIVEQATG